jgi:predicted metalloendopeptidase
MTRSTLAVAALLALAAAPGQAQRAATPATAPIAALNPADIDTTCKPCSNFYKFATGGWEKRTEIPAAFSSWSGFHELTERNNLLVREVLESAARDAETTRDADRRKLGRLYASCMDSTRAEADGATPIAGDLRRIAAIANRDQLRREIVRLHEEGMNLLFGAGADQDQKNSQRMIFGVAQAGLGLPDRDFYFKTDSAATKMRADYVNHVAAMLRLTGTPAAQATRDAARIMALETALAEPSLNRLQRRDPNTQYHFMSVADADTLSPGFSWRAYLNARGLQRVDSLDVSHPAFVKRMARELESRPLDDWKAYLRFHLAHQAAPFLSRAFVDQRFAYDSKLTGAREQQPRWRRCVGTVNGLLGDALGREYAAVAFTPEAKKAMDEMIDNLFAVYRERLETLPWMGPETQKQAMAKLGTFERKIGYPTKWRDYSALDIQRGSGFQNVRRAYAFEERRDLTKVGKPVDRTEWFMTVPTVNAYYSPPNNEIAFPAGRLQPPFFHITYDIGANYGGVGGTIGHEISHGFDDQGRKYDAQGNLRDWWTADDAQRFGELAGRIERQYAAYFVLDSLHLNARQTMGENIADVAGVSIAFGALKKALEGKPRVMIDGYTPEQRFFLAYAQARKQVWRDPALRLQVQTGVHSPGEFRVNGPLSNMPEFAETWGCKEGDPMVRPADVRAKIW